MGIFRKRPLAAGSFLFLVAVLLAYTAEDRIVFFAIPVLFAVGAIPCFLYRRKYPYFTLYFVILLLGCLLGVGRVALDKAWYRPLTEFIGSEVTVTAEVCETIYESDYYGEYAVDTITLNGRNTAGTAVLRTEGALRFRAGDIITATCLTEPLDYESYYKGQKNTYLAAGYRVILIPSELKNIVPATEKGILIFFRKLQSAASDALRKNLTGESGDLAAAMLLGDRSGLNDVIVRDFRRSGTSHLLAISGLHLAIVAGILDRVLYVCRAGKKVRLACILVFCVFYFFLTGCSYSTLRATLMLTFVALSFFFRDDADPLTSLLFSGAIILAVAPYSIFSTSYQMTMLSTFGILCFGKLTVQLERIFPRRHDAVGLLSGVCRTVTSSIAITVFSTIAVLPVLWLTFGEISLVSPLSNLLLLPLTMPLLVGSLLVLACTWSSPVAAIVALPVKGIATVILTLTEKFSRLPATISLEYEFLPYIFIPMFLLLGLLLFIDLKRYAGFAVTPVFIAAVAFAVCLVATGKTEAGRVEFSYYQSGNEEALLFFGSGDGMICDITGGSMSKWNAEYRQLRTMGATDIRVFLLTQYRANYPETFSAFSSKVLIRELWVPEPEDDRERELLISLLEVAAEHEIAVSVYQKETSLKIFRTASLTVSRSLYEDRSVKPAFSLLLENTGETLIYISGSYPEYLSHLGKDISFFCCDILILGSAGPIPKEPFTLPHNATCVVLTETTQLELLETIDEEIRYVVMPEHFCGVLH